MFIIKLQSRKAGCKYNSALQKCLGFGLQVPVHGGIAKFDGLLIDKVGPLYQLKFTAKADPLFPNPYQWTALIFTLSPSFDVVLGVQRFKRPRRLRCLGRGTPFQKQPIIALLDGGDNVVADSITL